MFPFGKNGINQTRFDGSKPTTACAYAKARALSSDHRFQDIDFLFYSLAQLESEKINKSIAVCGNRMRSKESNRVDNLHIYMKSLRGYSAYWGNVRGNMIAFLHNLGEPTWFVTLSARDLEWTDLRKKTSRHTKKTSRP